MKPLYKSVPLAMRWFNFRHSFPKTFVSTLLIKSGLKKSGQNKEFLAFTFSISEEYARLWLHFAKKNLPADKWGFLIIDCAGNMKKSNFPGAELIKMMNLPHGKKIDLILRKYTKAKVIFLSDDDKYLVSGIDEVTQELNNPKIAAISLSPRNWYKINIDGKEYLPMGSYAVLFKRDIIIQNNLSFMSLKKEFKARVMEAGSKKQFGYDTADYINEFLIKNGYQVITYPDNEKIRGYDGSSTPRIFLKAYGKDYVLQSLKQVGHYKKGSLNGSQMQGLYCLVKIESLFSHIFGESPNLASSITEMELVNILGNNPQVTAEEKKETLAYFSQIDKLTNDLKLLALN